MNKLRNAAKQCITIIEQRGNSSYLLYQEHTKNLMAAKILLQKVAINEEVHYFSLEKYIFIIDRTAVVIIEPGSIVSLDGEKHEA